MVEDRKANLTKLVESTRRMLTTTKEAAAVSTEIKEKKEKGLPA